MRLAVLKEIKGSPNVVLEYKEEQVLARLQSRVRENLSASEGVFKTKWTKEEVAHAIDKAWNELVSEFKEETIKLP